MTDYCRGVLDALIYAQGLLEAMEADAAAVELETVKARVEREAARRLEARLRSL